MGVSAVSTTGIYCRPGCSARPRPEHVTAYSTPVAAEAAGYRSCLKCRPDRTLAIADARGVPGPVARALALISDGFLDRHGEATLAGHVGYSARQLRRLFELHVGASPAFVARSRRAHFARRLLDESELPMAVIARAAGFGSERQMRRVVTDIFGFTPSHLRAKRRTAHVMTVDGGLRLRLPLDGPFDAPAAAAHLAARCTPEVEIVEGVTYRRTVEMCGNPGVLEIDFGTSPAGNLEVTAHLPTFDSIIDDVARVRAMLGLDDPSPEQFGADPVIGPLVAARPGTRVIGGWDRFESLIRIVIGQQVSVAGARTVAGTLVQAYGRALPAPALGLTRLFPGPEPLARAEVRALPMPRRRAEAIRAIARAVLDGDLDLYGESEPAVVRERLLAIPGIGRWTADVAAMRVWRDPDAFPSDDLGIRRALAQRLGRPAVSPAEAERLAEPWRPHRALAAQHLWASLAAVPAAVDDLLRKETA